MKRLLTIAALLVIGYFAAGQFDRRPAPADAPSVAPSATDALARAYDEQRSNVQVQAEGEVIRILPDDDSGSRHQRILLRMPSGQTVLIAHNIDLAERVEGLRPGDTLAFSGEYEWNEKGGVIHWTHRDPAGRHSAGWIRYDGRTYQ